MFYKRFVTAVLVVVLALVLGTSVLAQDNHTDVTRGENPLLEWLESLHNGPEVEESNWRFFEPLEKMIREASEKAQFDRLSRESRIAALNAIKPEVVQGLVSQGLDAFQSSDESDLASVGRTLKKVIDRLSDVFNIPQYAPLTSTLDQVDTN